MILRRVENLAVTKKTSLTKKTLLNRLKMNNNLKILTIIRKIRKIAITTVTQIPHPKNSSLTTVVWYQLPRTLAPKRSKKVLSNSPSLLWP